MLYLLGQYLQNYFGPFRLFTSHLFLGGLGLIGCAFLTWYLLPKLQHLLPRDRGRAFAVDAKAAQGKPTGAGMIFVSIFVFVQFLILPLHWNTTAILALTMAACYFGFLDDGAKLAWGEYKKGFIDLLVAGAAALVMCGMAGREVSGLAPLDAALQAATSAGAASNWLGTTTVWLPFTKMVWQVPPYLFIPLATILIWAAINCTNCTDGVDGLSGSLTGLAFSVIGAFLYFVVGHQQIASYLLIPHYEDGAMWAIQAFSMVGCLAGYLWYNAHPSSLLMGDAGSRALGFLLGVFVIASGNPFVIFIVSGVLLVNGGTGLVKVALLRFAKISIFRTIRFPLHDHFRHNRGWSNPQVLLRFAIVQIMISLVLVVLLLKIR